MPVYGHNSQAFDNWYRSDRDSIWDEESGTELTEFEESIRRSDAISRFALEASKSIVSDDAIDMNTWLALRGMESASADALMNSIPEVAE